MLSQESIRELQVSWLPNITDQGLHRLIDLLEKGSPLLVHGCFTRAVPMGCLATQAAWNHPETAHLTLEAGITWLHRVAGLNPATSRLIQEWDASGSQDWAIRADLLRYFKEEQSRRTKQTPTVNRLRELVEV